MGLVVRLAPCVCSYVRIRDQSLRLRPAGALPARGWIRFDRQLLVLKKADSGTRDGAEYLALLRRTGLFVGGKKVRPGANVTGGRLGFRRWGWRLRGGLPSFRRGCR